MAVLTFQDLEFSEEKGNIKVRFLKIYYFHISKNDLASIADFKVSEHSVELDCSEKKANSKFNQLLARGFESLTCSLSNLKTVYVHQNSGIPIIGEGVFGLIDRNTNCIEVKPLTACNLDCVFCSVDAGKSSRKITDFIVEEEYLVNEFHKLADKKEHPVEAHIGPQGEPLLYAPLAQLIRDLRKNPKVKIISIDTNGTLLTKKIIDELADAGLTRLNISLQAMDAKKCSYLANRPYNLEHVLEMIDYASKKISVLLAPVIVPGMNDDELHKILELGSKLKRNTKNKKSEFPLLGIQNFLNYKRGRNPVKQRSWEEFFELLKQLEQKTGLKLKLDKEDFYIQPDTKLEKPFSKKEIIKATVVCDGPMRGEKIASHKGRAIIVDKAERYANNSQIKVLIIRDKHNIFRGVTK